MKVSVTRDNVIIEEGSNKPHENEYNITHCYFTYDDFINSFQVKRAIFTVLSTGEMYETDIINEECEIPIEVLNHEYESIKLGVYGYNIGENEELVNRFSPSYDTFVVPTGSYQEGALSPEPITPSQYDIYSAKLQEGLAEVDEKLDEVVETVDGKLEEVDEKVEEMTTTVDNKLQEVDTKMDDIEQEVDTKIQEVDDKLDEMDSSIEKASRLDIDINKVDKDTTITITKQDGSTKSETVHDGYGLDYNWSGTSLGVKREDESQYEYTDLKGDCEFATFDIDFDTGELIMYKTSNMLIDFELNEETGELFVVIPRMEGGV